MANSRLRR